MSQMMVEGRGEVPPESVVELGPSLVFTGIVERETIIGNNKVVFKHKFDYNTPHIDVYINGSWVMRIRDINTITDLHVGREPNPKYVGLYLHTKSNLDDVLIWLSDFKCWKIEDD